MNENPFKPKTDSEAPQSKTPDAKPDVTRKIIPYRWPSDARRGGAEGYEDGAQTVADNSRVHHSDWMRK